MRGQRGWAALRHTVLRNTRWSKNPIWCLKRPTSCLSVTRVWGTLNIFLKIWFVSYDRLCISKRYTFWFYILHWMLYQYICICRQWFFLQLNIILIWRFATFCLCQSQWRVPAKVGPKIHLYRLRTYILFICDWFEYDLINYYEMMRNVIYMYTKKVIILFIIIISDIIYCTVA